jgi:Tol biopolymer transport system component
MWKGMTLAAGTHVGPYEIEGLLGVGGMGVVYRARDPRIGRDVALKVLPPALAESPERVRRFEAEARAAGGLNHPNVLAIHDVGAYEGAPYFVSELLSGQTLRERLAIGPLPVRKALELTAQAARGLAAAHERGVVHRDLKPENLFYTADGQMKILDFGLARLQPVELEAPLADGGSEAPTRARITNPGGVMGSPGYMAPEQVRGESADPRSDLFALGAVLFELLTGRPAFSGASQVERLSAILRVEPVDELEKDERFSPALLRALRRCLEKEPAERFQSARDLAFHLEALAGQSTEGMAALHPGVRRRRLLLRAGLAAGAAVVAVFAFFAGERQMEGQPPSFRRLTFRRGTLGTARFGPSGTAIFSATWNGGPWELYSTPTDRPAARPLGIRGADVASVSRDGQLALLLRPPQGKGPATLAQGSTQGRPLRELLVGVTDADWLPDGSALAVVRTVGSRSRLEFPAGAMLVETAGRLASPRVSRDGDRVAFIDHPFADEPRGSVVVVTRHGERQVLVGDLPRVDRLAWSPRGDEVWFTAGDAEGDLELRAISLRGRVRSLARVPGAPVLQDVDRDGRALLVFTTAERGMRWLGPRPSSERDLSWTDASELADLSADGGTVLFTDQRRVYARGVAGGTPAQLGAGVACKFSPDGKTVLSLAASLPPQLALYSVAGGPARTLAVNGTLALEQATWFPDGAALLLAGSEPGRGMRLYQLGLAGGKPQPLTLEGTGPDAALSPDGRQLAVSDDLGRLWLQPTAGGEPLRLGSIAQGSQPLGFSADGAFLNLVRFELDGRFARLTRFELGTGKVELLREIALPDLTARLSRVAVTPDGRSVAYSFARELSTLYLLEPVR